MSRSLAPRRHHLFALIIGAASLGLAACTSSPPAPADFDPTFPATSTPEGNEGAAPAIAGVPPCPPSLADAPQRPGPSALPDGSFECLTRGPAVNLAGLRDTPTVITIWASWCAPCRREIPLFIDLQSRAGRDVRVLGIDVRDRTSPARAAVEDFGMNFPSVRDPLGQTRRAVGYPGPPVTLFVDRDGVITYRKIGEVTSQKQLDDLVAQHLGVQVP